MTTKEKILKFLQKHAVEKFSIRQLHQKAKVSYPSAQRAVAVLDAEGKISVQDLGNTKLVGYKKYGKAKN